MRQLDILRRQVSTVNLALQSAGVEAHVTLDPEEANGFLNDGTPLVMLVEIERAEYETWNICNVSLRYILISSTQELLAAWEKLDTALEELAEPLEAETVTLSSFDPQNGDRTYPCAIVTVTTTEIEE